jgi:hypothetical protein
MLGKLEGLNHEGEQLATALGGEEIHYGIARGGKLTNTLGDRTRSPIRRWGDQLQVTLGEG